MMGKNTSIKNILGSDFKFTKLKLYGIGNTSGTAGYQVKTLDDNLIGNFTSVAEFRAEIKKRKK